MIKTRRKDLLARIGAYASWDFKANPNIYQLFKKKQEVHRLIIPACHIAERTWDFVHYWNVFSLVVNTGLQSKTFIKLFLDSFLLCQDINVQGKYKWKHRLQFQIYFWKLQDWLDCILWIHWHSTEIFTEVFFSFRSICLWVTVNIHTKVERLGSWRLKFVSSCLWDPFWSLFKGVKDH